MISLNLYADFPQSYAYTVINVENKHIAVSKSKKVIKLSDYNVPSCATEVVIYARVRCGHMKGDHDGNVIVESGGMVRKLFFHTYHQGAWSFNSDYFTMPISTNARTITTYLQIFATGNFAATVQVVGYIQAD